MLETNVMFRHAQNSNESVRKLTNEEIKQVQVVLLDMMSDIDRICRGNGLTYFLCGGSCLGAVRHQGFIPWDDDIDIVMPRSDYDRLTGLMLKEFPDKYWVQDISIDEKYDLNSLKIRRKGTVCRELLDPEPEISGIFIDVYSLEDTFNNRVLRGLHGLVGEFYLMICSCIRIKNKESIISEFVTDKKDLLTVKTKAFIGKLFFWRSTIGWLRKTEKVLRKDNASSSRYVTIPTGRWHYFGEMHERDIYFPPREMKFEDKKFFIMNDADAYLKKMYGSDYLTLPEEKDREKHAVCQFEICYDIEKER